MVDAGLPSDLSARLTILTPKQILGRLLIALEKINSR